MGQVRSLFSWRSIISAVQGQIRLHMWKILRSQETELREWSSWWLLAAVIWVWLLSNQVGGKRTWIHIVPVFRGKNLQVRVFRQIFTDIYRDIWSLNPQDCTEHSTECIGGSEWVYCLGRTSERCNGPISYECTDTILLNNFFPPSLDWFLYVVVVTLFQLLQISRGINGIFWSEDLMAFLVNATCSPWVLRWPLFFLVSQNQTTGASAELTSAF